MALAVFLRHQSCDIPNPDRVVLSGPESLNICVVYAHLANSQLIEDVLVYTGIAAVDVDLGATQMRHGDPANMYHPGEFRYGGGHVIEDLVAGKELQLFALSYGTDEYPLREIRTYFTIDDLTPSNREFLQELNRLDLNFYNHIRALHEKPTKM